MSNLPPDPWKVLGVDKIADKTEIRSAYRKLVLKCHPDKVQDPTLKAQKQDEFQKVQQAYELLNDDTERAKYEDQVKLAELRKAAMLSKNLPNTSASRTPPRSAQVYSYDVRSAEPREVREVRYRHASPHRSSAVPPSSKMYSQFTTRSYEDDVSPRSQENYDDERRARRAASYEQTPRREDDKREERKRREVRGARDRKEEEDRERERERREKELRKQEKRDREKTRDKERRRDVEEKSSRRSKMAYVEPYEGDDVYPPSSKKISPSVTSKQVVEPREKSASRRERAESPRVETDAHAYVKAREDAAAYIERHRNKSRPVAPSLGRSQTFQETYHRAPSPPPAPVDHDFVDDARRSSARPVRRSSNDGPITTKERLHSSSQKKSREGIDVAEAVPRVERPGPPRAERVVPVLRKSDSVPAPPPVPESPPRRPLRSNTETYARPPPAMPGITRAQTFDNRYLHTMVGEVLEPEEDDFDERDRRRHRSSRRSHSPEAMTTRRYKPSKTTPTVEPVYEADDYAYHEERRPSRRHPSSYEPRVETGGAAYYYADEPALPPGFKVKYQKPYRQEDVTYSPMNTPAQTQWSGVTAS